MSLMRVRVIGTDRGIRTSVTPWWGLPSTDLGVSSATSTGMGVSTATSTQAASSKVST